MENLNDVEFGSNQSKEEAPILVAQRYLNIFRQVHIFNKQKRDQFDNELLELPDNIIDFIKKMPGGRLLIEHIEEVKTERGISFVKTSRDDFISPSSDTPAAAPVSSGTPVVGGSLVMDSSFAETFASSMAKAFQQAPSSPAGGAVIPANLGSAFNLIAEEIKSSRASLLDVLREIRNITDSVIATQVSISRILEGLLSSGGGQAADPALSNNILASQTSITKLLENIYNNSTKKNEEISHYLDVDNKLQSFRNELSQTMMNSLQNFTKQVMSSVQTRSATAGGDANIDAQLAQFKNEVNQSLSEMRQMLYNVASLEKPVQPQQPVFQTNVANADKFDEYVSSEEHKKKKKKKKKRNNGEISALTSTDFSNTSAQPDFDDADDTNDFDEPSQDFSSQIVDGVIKNSSYNNEDDFSNVHPEIPVLDTEISSPDSAEELPVSTAEDSDIDDILSGLDDIDLDLPQENTTATPVFEKKTESEPLNLDDFGGDIEEISPKEDNDDTTLSVPEVETEAESEPLNLDDFSTDDSDLTLPEDDDTTPSVPEVETEAESEPLNLDDFGSDDSDLALPEDDDTTSSVPEVETEAESEPLNLDDFGSDDTNLALPEDDDTTPSVPEVETEAETESESLNLDDFGSDDTDLALPEDDDTTSSVPEVETEEETESEPLNLDDFGSDDTESVPPEYEDDVSTPTSSHSSSDSRYAAQMDKIRAALTGDGIDISSLDEPITLDDYSDDENVPSDSDFTPPPTNNAPVASSDTTDSSDDDWEYEYVEDEDADNSETPSSESEAGGKDNNGDWEWEYVDENGNAVPAQSDENNGDDEEWEWEYVDEDDNASNDENKQQ